MVQIYPFFVSIGYIEEDQVNWPPHSNETFLAEQYKINNISDNGIALLQHLPWPKPIPNEGESEIFRKARAIDYSNEDVIEGTRHPIMGEYNGSEEDPYERLSSNMITLAFGEYDEAPNVILDANDGELPTALRQNMSLTLNFSGTLREWHNNDDLMNSKPLDACKYLQDTLERYKTLQEMPVNGQIISDQDIWWLVGLTRSSQSFHLYLLTASVV